MDHLSRPVSRMSQIETVASRRSRSAAFGCAAIQSLASPEAHKNLSDSPVVY
jgi:hypothetical protein